MVRVYHNECVCNLRYAWVGYRSSEAMSFRSKKAKRLKLFTYFKLYGGGKWNYLKNTSKDWRTT